MHKDLGARITGDVSRFGARVVRHIDWRAHQHVRGLAPVDVLPHGQASPPSFRRRLHDLNRGPRELKRLDPQGRHPLRQIPFKLRNYRLASSHGVPVPEVLRVWATLDGLDLTEAPETFVLKADRGAASRGVLPLRRVDHDAYRVVGERQVMTQEQVRAHLRQPKVKGPFFIEPLLAPPQGDSLPQDIKLYMFYGELGHVMLRRMARHGDMRRARYRFLDEDGADLGDDVAPGNHIDPTIEPPQAFADYVAIARHLSRAVALPFIRVDLLETDQGPVFGELTRAPGGRQWFRDDHDLHLGRLWDQAQCRMELDLADGRPFRNLRGEHPSPPLYPAGHEPRLERDQGQENLAPLPCSKWCVRPV
ncbi:MAG TPA: ATP-grasp fold amidoligase family protein [Ornithinimicrobium sp.]|uniref:ATP-grasp fold amidoligase family protein n=1 Tax=Ornithinimicrobium sp. TaxID=1977084 RepID=UPI002B495254|nr:ATP-grasp fold amidoligase family protein [Ornithinimicrobium sp.]HKJ10870.1 ATP-grasp fold amidoligase family protein [Ornithinimicrobium sp.]